MNSSANSGWILARNLTSDGEMTQSPRSVQPSEIPDSYLTLATSGESELRIQRSRFLGFAYQADCEEEARTVVGDLARRYHDARHVCFAWRVGVPPQIRELRNDDGEPGGTAGEPILTAIRRRELTCCLTAVVRYFGGIKLGTGGLSRAYGQAATEALAAATVREVLLGREFRLEFAYSLQKTMTYLLDGHRGRTIDATYTDLVVWRVWLPHSTWAAFAGAVSEATAGSVVLDSIPGPEYPI